MSVDELLQTLQAFDTDAIFPSHDTPYSKYSTTNYAASGIDIPVIRDIVSQCRDQLITIDTILELMETIVHELSDRREQIASSMTTHKGYISCIRRLPADILREIFMHCLPDEKYPTPDPDIPPLLLTQICGSWQEVALDTPRLWCSLSIKETEEDLIDFYHENWLRNARLCPLSLEVSLLCEIDEEYWPSMAINFTRLYSSRCTDLSVHFDRTYGLKKLLEDLPNLERLTLTGDMDTLRPEKISIVQPHPRLHTLIINSPTFVSAVTSTFHPGWTHLVRLAVSLSRDSNHIGEHIFSTLLRVCPNLEHLAFSPVRIDKQDDPVALTHSKLRVLDIGELYNHHLDSDTFMFPNLSHLRIRGPINANTILDDTPIPEDSFPHGLGNRIFKMTLLSGSSPYLQPHALFVVFNPGWTELTHLRLDIQVEAKFCLIPLQFCPRLENMILSIADSWRYPKRPDPLTHPMLRSLTIEERYTSVAKFFATFTLPSLCHLDVSQYSHPWPHQHFKQFFDRSRCPLETLKIRAERITREEREEITSVIPTLKDLDLYDRADSVDNWIKSLGVPSLLDW